MREPVRASYRLREFACAHTLRRERCRPSGPTVRPKGARGGACRGPAGPRGRVPVWPSSAPRAGPRAALRGGCARTLHGVRAWGRGRFVPRCRALGRWGPAPRPLFRHFAPGGALGPLGRWGPGFRRGLGRARPLRRGGPAPPMACPCVPVSAALRASSRGIGRPCLLRPCRPAFAAGPRAPPSAVGGARGPAWGPPRPAVARLRSTRRGRARPAGRAYWARCAPAGVWFCWACSFAPAVAGVGWPVPLGGPVRPAPPLRAAILYRKCSVLEHVLSGVSSRREDFSLALWLVPCAYSYAIDALRPYHISGSTASIPSLGNRRRDSAAPRVLVP